jgi:DNA-directed RNA polymerase subunit RPC12/RpoP
MALAVGRVLDSAAAARAEVRRCASCGNPALICVNAWQHSVNGISSNMITRDCQCQACGATVTLHPRWKIIPLWIVAGLLLPSLIGSIVPGIMAFRRGRAWRKNPIVPDAPMPRIRYRSGPGPRRCDCGDTLVLKNVTKNSHNGISTGIEYEYSCGKCGKNVTLESALGIIMSIFGSLLLGGVAAVVFYNVQSVWWRWGGSIVLALLGVFLFWQAVTRTVGRWRYPELPSDLL